VTERDAFGNPIDRGGAATTGLAGLETGDPLRAPAPPAPATTAPAPAPTIAPPASAAAPQPPLVPYPPRFTPPERKASFDWLDKLVGLAVVAIFVVPLAIGGWVAWSTWHDTAKPAIGAIKDVQRSLTPDTPGQATGATPTPARAAQPPTGLAARSLLRPAAVGRVVAAARRAPGGRLGLLRLAPERADLQLARAGGGLSLVQLRWDGSRTVIRSPGSAPSQTIPWAAVDRGAPQRLVRAAARRLHRPAGAVDYVVLVDILGGPRWSAYFKGGAAFQGDAHGRLVRRIS
jgi:hypothetical protein